MTMLADTAVVRDVARADTAELVELLNAIITKRGTTALEERTRPRRWNRTI